MEWMYEWIKNVVNLLTQIRGKRLCFSPGLTVTYEQLNWYIKISLSEYNRKLCPWVMKKVRDFKFDSEKMLNNWVGVEMVLHKTG